jgi:PKD repeat protein
MLRNISPVPSASPVRITPGAPVSGQLSDQPIPFYFRLGGDSKLDQVWNPGHALRFRFGSNTSYHKRDGSTDSCIHQPMDHNPDQHAFYRIEGHIGKSFTEALQTVEAERERLNLPVKVIGLKLSHNPANIAFDAECRFDDLDQQYDTITTDLSCLFEEEITFFTHLRIRTNAQERPDDNTGSSPGVSPGASPGISPGVSAGINTGINTGMLDFGGAMRSGATSTFSTGAIAANLFQETKLAAEQAGDGAHFMVMNYVPTQEFNVTLQTNFITTGDLLTHQLQLHQRFDFSRIINDFKILFPDIRIPDLLILKPVQLANQMRAILELLPGKAAELDAPRLSAAFDSMIKIATDYRNDLHNSDSDLDGQKAMILFRLDKLIHVCARQKLLSLFQRYRDRIRKYSELRLLKKFAETHSGMEHFSGVPSGGTFVMVYVDENEPSEQPVPGPGPIPTPPVIQPIPLPPTLQPFPPIQPLPPLQPSLPLQPFPQPARPSLADLLKSSRENLLKSISTPISTTDARTLTNDLQAITNTLKLDVSIPSDLRNRISELERDVLGKIDDLVALPRPGPSITRNVVVADFSLPYLYKCECPEVSMVVISQIVFSLPKTEFCRNDRSRYEFLTDPAGGIVESSAGGVVAEGNRFFFVPARVDADGEAIRFTYQINNQTVHFHAKVFHPVAAFRFETRQSDDGSLTVVFRNTSTGAERFEWDFGDGQTSTQTDPVHTYRDFRGDRAVVSLTAHKSGCSDRTSRQVEIPQPVPVEFTIENKRDFPERTYCTTDEQLFRFHARPQGSLIEGRDMRGVRQTHDGFVLIPSAYAPGSYEFSYMGEKLTVKIVEGPTGDFTHEVLRESDSAYTIRFVYKGENVKSVAWRIGRRNPLTGEQVDVTFEKREGRTHTVDLQVLSANGCVISVSRTLTFEVRIPGDDFRPDTGSLFGDLITRFDTTRNTTLDDRLFGGTNPVADGTSRVIAELARDVSTADGAERFRTGEMNDRIAADFRHLLDESAKLVAETSRTRTEEEARYTVNLFDAQASTLIRLVSDEEKDVNKTSDMGKLLVHLNTSIREMKDDGITVDPDGMLRKTVAEAKKATADQPKLHEAILNIDRTLKM